VTLMVAALYGHRFAPPAIASFARRRLRGVMGSGTARLAALALGITIGAYAGKFQSGATIGGAAAAPVSPTFRQPPRIIA